MSIVQAADGLKIDQWMIDTYESNVIHGMQQRTSRLEGTVKNFQIEGERKRFQYIGGRTLKELTDPRGETVFTDSNHEVRWAYSKPYYDAFTINKKDVEKCLTDPTSDTVIEAVNACNRKKDEVIIAGFKANVLTGKDGDVSKAFPTANTLDVQLGSPSTKANQGLNLAKLKETKYRMDCAEIDEIETRYFLISAKQLQDLLNSTEVTNKDYNTVQALVEGKIDHFLGFKFIRLQLLPFTASTGIRSCFAYIPSAMRFGMRKGISVQSGVLPDRHFTPATEIQIDLSAIRLYDGAVFEVPCQEADPVTEAAG